ncbi:hypothetical protein MHB44_21720 [Lysinibacillus sp. FSL H8-0500]|uniref:hypothetical protein n=1 Tax=Lysinibacillus sp. FSL H8-0500 TaxID=2921393 RepID=UPI0031011AF8
MSIKNELEKSLPTSIKLSENEKAMIQAKVQQAPPSRYYWKPLLISILAVMLIGISLLSTMQSSSPADSAAVIMESEPEEKPVRAPLPPLTDEVKKQYYQEYVKIIDEVMAAKPGMNISVVPIEQFEDDFWVTPEDFRKDIQSWVDHHLATEREKIDEMLRGNPAPVITNENGHVTKKTYMYFSDILIAIEVTGNFKTAYHASRNRQIFSSVQDISTKLTEITRGAWKQTSSKATLLDGGRTIEIQIEGIFEYNTIRYEKRFTIEFYCDENGEIH